MEATGADTIQSQNSDLFMVFHVYMIESQMSAVIRSPQLSLDVELLSESDILGLTLCCRVCNRSC